jgi:hypothetical protein
MMFVVDDPFMALILRFVVDTEDEGISNEEYLQRQLKALRKYLAPFPEAEHRTRAMEWIAEHAARFRRDWERNTVASGTQYLRCADCPLADVGASEQCEIHEQWLYLLHLYLTDETASQEYIEDALILLGKYKEQHRQRLTFAAMRAAGWNEAKKGEGKKNKKKKKQGKGKKEKT